MGGVNTSMLAIVAAIAIASVGWVAINLMRAGWDYAAARGNPRNRAQAHETLFDIGKGALLIGGAAGMAAWLIATLVWA